MLPEWYNEYKDFVESTITHKLNTYFSKKWDSNIHSDFIEIIKYALVWWKKLRAILALETYLSIANKSLNQINIDDDICNFIVALECVHAYSLIHDDLPAMDNDELRRWIPTVWKKYGEYNAILAWDLLNTFTFELLSDIKNPLLSQKCTRLISTSVWHYWMIGGQVEDLYFEKNIHNLNISTLENIHHKKTWALISASIIGGAILSEKSFDYEEMKEFWKNIWLAFQIRDDILDEIGTVEETGKSIWWEKKGFVYFLWLEKSEKLLEQILQKSKATAKKFNSEKINFLVDYIGSRKK